MDPYLTPLAPSTPSLSHTHASGASSSSMTPACLSNFSNESQCSDSPSSPSTMYTSRLGLGYGYGSNYSLDGTMQAEMEGQKESEVMETYELFEGFGRKPRREKSGTGDAAAKPNSMRTSTARRSVKVAAACSDSLQAARDLIARGGHHSAHSSISAKLDTWASRYV